MERFASRAQNVVQQAPSRGASRVVPMVSKSLYATSGRTGLGSSGRSFSCVLLAPIYSNSSDEGRGQLWVTGANAQGLGQDAQLCSLRVLQLVNVKDAVSGGQLNAAQVKGIGTGCSIVSIKRPSGVGGMGWAPYGDTSSSLAMMASLYVPRSGRQSRWCVCRESRFQSGRICCLTVHITILLQAVAI